MLYFLALYSRQGVDEVGEGQDTMEKRVRHRIVRLYPYDLTAITLWRLPLIGPSPTPLAPYLRKHTPQLRKIHLVSIAPVKPN